MILLFVLSASTAWGHSHLVSPVPRDPSTGIKTGPCGTLPKPAVATQTFTSGQTIVVQFQETIDHPGRYFISFSPANDLNFNLYLLATVPDIQDPASIPHNYSASITLPNISCTNCTLQLIQSMEEVPASPTYYYSCADINLVGGPPAPTPSPMPSPTDTATVGSLGVGSSGTTQKARMGSSCGSIAIWSDHNGRNGGPGPSSGSAIMSVLTMLLPLMILLLLKMSSKIYSLKFGLNMRVLIALAIAFLGLSHTTRALAQTKPAPTTISGPFGSKPIQLSIGANGITRKEGGYICDLDASIGKAHFSEWGETENDARSIVAKKCYKNAGFLLCKKDKITCKQEK